VRFKDFKNYHRNEKKRILKAETLLYRIVYPDNTYV